MCKVLLACPGRGGLGRPQSLGRVGALPVLNGTAQFVNFLATAKLDAWAILAKKPNCDLLKTGQWAQPSSHLGRLPRASAPPRVGLPV